MNRPVRAPDALWALGGSLLLVALLRSAGTGDWPFWAQLTAGELAFLAGACGVLLARRLGVRDALGIRRPLKLPLLMSAVGAAALHLFLSELSVPVLDAFEAMGMDYTKELEAFEDRIAIERAQSPVALYLAAALMPALCEELLFRGIVLNGFARSFGAGAAICLSSALFGAVHPLAPRMLFTLVLGLYFGWVVWRTGGVVSGMAAHAVNNVLALSAVGDRTFDLWPALLSSLVLGAAVWAVWRQTAPGDR